jgi:rhodanese-related sulfurtransferase
MCTAPATITTAEFAALLAKGAPLAVLDVRTPAEFAECHVACAKLAPLDALDPRKAGGRATKAVEQFIAAGIPNVTVVTGGTDACVAANVPVERGAKAAIPLDGQVRILLGALILVFWLLARYLHPAIGYLVPLMAAGLICSGLTGFCGMALLLGKAPWNQNKDTGSCRAC